jgi:hypothetical protein
MFVVNKRHRGAVLNENGSVLYYHCEFGDCQTENWKTYRLASHLGKHLRRVHKVDLPFYWGQGLREIERLARLKFESDREHDLSIFLQEAKRRAAISTAQWAKGILRDNNCVERDSIMLPVVHVPKSPEYQLKTTQRLDPAQYEQGPIQSPCRKRPGTSLTMTKRTEKVRLRFYSR